MKTDNSLTPTPVKTTLVKDNVSFANDIANQLAALTKRESRGKSSINGSKENDGTFLGSLSFGVHLDRTFATVPRPGRFSDLASFLGLVLHLDIGGVLLIIRVACLTGCHSTDYVDHAVATRRCRGVAA